MNTRVAEAEAAVVQLFIEMRFKTSVIGVVNQQLAAGEIFIPKETLLAQKSRLRFECNELLLQLALHKMYLALQRRESFLFLS